MLELARQRAAELGHPATLQHGDAHQLRFDDASCDTVVCTFRLCAIPTTQALAEMTRVLRAPAAAHPGRSSAATPPVRAVQRLLELVTVPLGGEHFLRRPLQRCARRTTSTSIVVRRVAPRAGRTRRCLQNRHQLTHTAAWCVRARTPFTKKPHMTDIPRRVHLDHPRAAGAVAALAYVLRTTTIRMPTGRADGPGMMVGGVSGTDMDRYMTMFARPPNYRRRTVENIPGDPHHHRNPDAPASSPNRMPTCPPLATTSAKAPR